MTKHASGTFDVKLTSQTAENAAEGAMLGRTSLDKQFHGDLEGTSKGEMLTAVTNVKGSAGYVAMEKFTITVVPDSGTGQLAGLAGRMTGTITDGKHSYEFEYTLAGTP